MIISKNPYTGEKIAEFKELTSLEIDEALAAANSRFTTWRTTNFTERAKLMNALASELKNNKNEYAKDISGGNR